jgi:tRNA/tmRNA/rRNA uracil-C5-methylase (TrmA/RlmC/RlmD family)
MPAPGDVLDLRIDKPAAGGRMLARHDGQIVLVAGAIPGERVTARVEREHRGVIFAGTVDVLEPHAGRRPALPDPGCGGTAYSHIALPVQQQLKAAIVADAFARIARIEVEPPPGCTSATACWARSGRAPTTSATTGRRASCATTPAMRSSGWVRRFRHAASRTSRPSR